MTLPEWLDNPTFAGLLFDICGAIVLGRGIFFNSLINIAEQSDTHWDFNPQLRLALCEQRVDALFRLPLLVIGFALQAWGSTSAIQSISLAGSGLGVLTMVVLAYLL